MSRFWNTIKSSLVLALAGLVVVTSAWAVNLPDNLVDLLPGDPDLVMVITSMADAERAWGEVQTMVQEFSDDPDDQLPGFREMMQDMEPQILDMIAWDKPLVASVTLANLMGGQEPRFAFVIPVNNQDYDIKSMASAMEMPTVRYSGDYVLVSKDLEFIPAASPSPLLERLPKGTIALCANLQTLWAELSPMLDFALMSMNTQQPVPEGEQAPPAPEMSPEEVTALGDMVHAVMESADMMTMGMDLRDQEVFFTEEFVTLPGSVLAPQPQPDFKKALQLTKLFDSDADMVGAYALEVNEMVDLYKDFYLLSLENSMAELQTGLSAPLSELMEPYFQAMHLTMVPSAFALDIGHETLDMSYALLTADAQTIIDQQVAAQATLSKVFPFMTTAAIDAQKVEGYPVVGWDYDWDKEGLLALMGNEYEDEDGEAEKIMGALADLYNRVLPGVRLVATDSHMFMSLGREVDPLKDMIYKAKKNKGKVHSGLARAAKQAGPSCQGVFQGDLATIMSLVFEMVEEFSDEDLPALELDPIPMSYTVRIDDRAYAVDYVIGMEGFPELLKALDEMGDD